MLYFGMAPAKVHRSDMEEAQKPRMRAVHVLAELLDDYIETVERSPMTERSKYTYITQADMFVRWVKGEFEPGETLW